MGTRTVGPSTPAGPKPGTAARAAGATRRGRTGRGAAGLGRRGRRGAVAFLRRPRVVVEVHHDLAGAGAGYYPWEVRIRVVRRILALHEEGGGPPVRYRHRSGAAKAARDLAAELGLDPWADVEVVPE